MELQGLNREKKSQRKESIKQIVGILSDNSNMKKKKNAIQQYKLTERNYRNETRSVNFPN